MKQHRGIAPFLLAGLVAVGVTTDAAAAGAPAVGTDCYGDPLPPGAIVRFGSIRLRYPNVMWIAPPLFSPDGKVLATSSLTTRLWDTADGRLLREFDPNEMATFAHAFTPDGKHLITLHGMNVLVWDTSTGKKQPFWPKEDVVRGCFTSVSFSPDGGILALAGSTREDGDDLGLLRVYDFKTRKELGMLRLPDAYDIGVVSCSPDGKRLAFGAGWALHVYDVASGRLVVKTSVEGALRHLAFAPDGRSIAVHPYEKPVSILDAATGKVLLATRVTGGTPSDLRFTPDGKTLLFAGCSGPVVAIDPTSKAEPREIVRLPLPSFRPSFSPDGRRFAGRHEDVVHLWDTTTGREVPTFDDHRDGTPVEAVPSPDGGRVATRSKTELRIWERNSGKLLRKIAARDLLPGLSWTGDGKTLVAGSLDTLTWYDTDGGQVVRQVKLEIERFGKINPRTRLETALTPDGQTIVCSSGISPPSEFHLFDALTGRALKPTLPLDEGETWRCISADGKRALTTLPKDPPQVCLRDAATGRRLWQAVGPTRYGVAFCFSSDNRLVAATSDQQFVVWETASGRVLGRAPFEKDLVSWCRAIRLSPDGRTLVVVIEGIKEFIKKSSHGFCTSGQGRVLLFEVRSGRLRRALSCVDGRLTLAFTSDGRYLVTGSSSGTAVLWEMYPASGERLSEGEARRLVALLAEKDAQLADAAICRLLTAPEVAVPLLRERLQPLDFDRAKIKRWIVSLDSDVFATRESAEIALEEMEEAAAPFLREALANKPTPELARRAKRLLESVETLDNNPRDRLLSRGMEVLEQTGTEEALEIVKRIAAVGADTRLIAEARATATRMAEGLKGKKRLPSSP
jgi:WD40 repeat protein